KISGDHPPPALARACARRGDLAPAAGRGPQIGDALSGLEKLVLVVDLDELVGRARPVAFAARLRDIGVVELAFEPKSGGEGALARCLDPGFERSAALATRAARRHQRSRGRRCGPTPSARIMWLR